MSILTERFGHPLVTPLVTPCGGASKGRQMTVLTPDKEFPAVEPVDNAKRRQIIEGARQVFLAQGFDGASMGQIAREAGVSKGTLYVYFDSKEDLFQVVAYDECLAQAEQVFALDPDDHAVGTFLTRLAMPFR